MNGVARRVLVTGAGSGIGRAIAERFSSNGDVVAGLDIDASRMADLNLAFTRACDVRDESAIAIAIADSASELGGLDVLVNSAGVTSTGTVVDISSDEWNRVMDTNVRGVLLASKYALPYLGASPSGGSIVNIASQLGIVAVGNNAAYCASKGAVIQLTRAMAIDHAPDGVTVNALCPGPTWTPAIAGHIAGTKEPERTRAAFASTTLHGRFVTVSEIADAAMYLASPSSRSTTGSCLVVDGGYSIR